MVVALLVSLVFSQLPGDSLTLHSALARARASRGQVRAAAARVDAARAGVRVAGTVPNPVASYSYTDDPPRQHVSLDQSLDWLLTRGSERRAAESDVRRALADSTQATVDLTAEVRGAFYGVLAARELEQVTREQGVVADSLLAVANRRLATGDIAETERDQLALEATRAGARLSRAREAGEVAWARLARTIGLPPSPEHPLLAGAIDDGLDLFRLGAPTDQASAAVSPRIRAAEADSAASAERAVRAARARVPLPSIIGGADWDNPGGPPGPLAVVGISIPLPLWQHGTGSLAAARAEAAQAAALASESRLEVQRQVVEARSRLAGAAERARTTRDSLLPLARTLRARATTAYRVGQTGVIPLLEALRAERDIEAETVDDVLSFQEALAEWKRALGEAE